MLLSVVLCATLSLPFAACFNTEECLSKELLGSLPEGVKDSAEKVKGILNSNTWLHFDQEQQTWNLGNILFFREEYLPALLEFAAAAAKTLTFERVNPHLKKPPSLKDAVQHLLNTAIPFKVGPASPELSFQLFAAKENFMIMARTWESFVSMRTASIDHSLREEWSIECDTLVPTTRIALSASPICPVIREVTCESRRAASELLQALQNDNDNLAGLTKELEKSTKVLPELFDTLQRLARGFRRLDSWLGWRTVRLWGDALEGGPLEYLQIWPQQGRSDAHSVATRREFIRIVNRFRASLLTGSILLELTGAEIKVDIAKELPEIPVYEKAQTWLESAGPRVAPILEKVSALAQSCQQAGDFADCTRQLSALIFGLAGGPGEDAHIFNLTVILPTKLCAAPKLKEGTLKALKDAYGLAKRLLGAYVAALKVGSERLEGCEWDNFLLQLLHDTRTRKLLLSLKMLMHKIELLRLSGVEHYNWPDFPLYHVPNPLEGDGSGVQTDDVLGKRRRNEDQYTQKMGDPKRKK